jgi:uncharacterized protein with ParB-like and HNH nuclease domain
MKNMATWEPKTVKEIVQSIEDDAIVLPVIQRNLVWEEEKIELLFDSLLKENSFGGIMALEEEKGNQPLFAFRRFIREGEEQDSKLPERLDRSIRLIIDGQQRLQAFYMGLKGSYHGKELYFNLLSEKDYIFEFAKQESELPVSRGNQEEVATLWVPIRTLYKNILNTGESYQVANEIIQGFQILDEKNKNVIRENIHRFEKTIFEQKTVGISLVKVNKNKIDEERRRMVELFRRLNSGGTILTTADLMASMLKSYNPKLEEFLRKDISDFGKMGIYQDEVIKLLFLLRNNYIKEVTDINKEDAEFAIDNRDKIIKTLKILQEFLVNAKLDGYYRDRGKSVIPLYAVAYHLFHKDKNLDNLYEDFDTNNPDYNNLKTWIYLSILNGVFSRGCGWTPYRTGIRRILEILKQYKNTIFPADELFKLYETYPLVFKREITAQYLPSWDRTFVFYLMYGCQSLAGRDIDHIQPKSQLEARGIEPEKIHSVANFQLLTVPKNRGEKKDKELKEWIKGMDDNYLEFHLIPTKPQFWLLEKFDDFLNARMELILHKINIPTKIMPSKPTKIQDDEEVRDDISKTYDKGALWAKVPNEYKALPILKDDTPLFNIFKEFMPKDRIWPGRYRNELALAQIKTVSDFALLVITLKLKYYRNSTFGKCYQFDNENLFLKTKEFGGYGWRLILDHLRKQGLDWQKFIIK